MIFLDSSLIVAYLNEVDVNHAKALQIIKDLDRGRYGSSVITDYIFDEVITVMLFKIMNLGRVVELGEKILSANLLFRVNEDLFEFAWKIFKEQEKPVFSFTDCTSIATCRINGISTIATFDEDFQRLKGFRIIGP
ncbi:type II toxin-antitoxin system VapC family toxin [Candidatus Bathyarchaeota archaeon]|nr:type II toxin-antitoxin system VapC family toxin [Candidatus Bathyarchaeota archaeon]MBS7629137.1 type II toxin-antitoxin system VapC family toxin [Candidatus Bathyarchaeota archaeon]MBS7631920.1 type II toxin-antitoxin system VapC family toxin [Candidatus Bathyarchaeota archaeon]